MGWLKNSAIKRTTKKRTMILWNGINETLNANPNMQIKEALVEYMENLSLAESLFPVSPASSSLHDIFSEFVNKVEQDGELSWHELFFQWTAYLVFGELSYDPTIGTKEDLKIVHTVVYDLLRKWISL